MKRLIPLLLLQLFIITSFAQTTNNELKGKRLTIGAKSITAISNDTALTTAADSNKLATLYAAKRYADISVLGINAKKFGAKGDGATDDKNALQTAIDFISNAGGGMVLLSEGNFRVTAPLFLRSNVVIKGIPGKTRIYNDKAIRVKAGDQSVIFMGNYAPLSYNSTRKYNAQNILSGSNFTRLTNAADVDSFSVGSIVLVESGLATKGTKQYFIPKDPFINRVTAISGDTLFFQDPISDTLLNVKVGTAGRFSAVPGSVDPFGVPSYICYNAGLEDLTLESLYGSWNSKNGSFHCYWKNVTTIGLNGIYGNGFAYFTAENVTSYFTNKAVEMAMYSHDSRVDKLTAIYTDKFLTVDNEDDVDRCALKFGENSRNISITNSFINAAQKSGESAVLFGTSYNNSLTNSKVYADSMSLAAVEFRCTRDTTECLNNIVENVDFKTYGTNRFVKVYIDATADTLAALTGNQVINCRFKGTIAPDGLAVFFSGQNNAVYGSWFAQGSFDANPNASNNFLYNSYIPDTPYRRVAGVITAGNFTLSSLVDNQGADTSNTWRGYKAGEVFNLNAINNTANGKRALNKNQGGKNNTATGSGALENNVNADGNTANGTDALKNNTTGNNSTAVGFEALSENQTGTGTAMGYRALKYSRLNFNSAFGREAGTGVLNGTYSNNSLFGYRAGYSLFAGSNNSYFGGLSGWQNDGSRNTFYGYGTGSNALSVTNSILIGANVLSRYNANGVLNIGGILFGNGLVNSPDSSAQNGKIGINITDPIDYFELPGATATTAPIRLRGGISPTGADIRNGQVWLDTVLNHIYIRINGITYQLDQPTVLGTVTAGTWNAGLIGSLFGGTGVANAGTLTYGSNNIALTTSGATALTLPATGTLSTLAGTENFSNKTFTTDILLTSGVGIGSAAAPAGVIRAVTLRSGTGQNLNLTANAAGNIIGFNQSTTEIARFAATTGNFLINTTTDAGFKIDVNGTARFTGAVRIGPYTLPATDGTANQVLKTNGSGVVTWQDDTGTGGGSGTVTNVSFTDGNGFDGTITNPTTTPAINLALNVTGGRVLVSSAGGTALETTTATTSDLAKLVALRPKATQTLTDGATITFDIANGNHARVTIGGARTLSISNLADGDEGWIVVTQDGTGGRTLALPSSSTTPNGFGGGNYLELSVDPGKVDILFFIVDGSTIRWTISKDQIAAGS